MNNKKLKGIPRNCQKTSPDNGVIKMSEHFTCTAIFWQTK